VSGTIARGLVRYLSRVAAPQVTPSFLWSALYWKPGTLTGRMADHAEQRRADAVLTRHNGVANATLRLENLLAGSGIGGEAAVADLINSRAAIPMRLMRWFFRFAPTHFNDP
jgi:hypothetical protein